ncbi:MAG TPA: hypothetical protein VH187_01495 [Scandinavium sp.]|jgi:hypothetical protein|uniref:hypothetical protein n=1 Tax=Scandinavium sp. TaxID=2830653 RepID=UPI002E371FF9|nr:hypothetical protein [Scandinavium sp.]HEX4499832.1 hypothetical protein [Scandinavium sp.]
MTVRGSRTFKGDVILLLLDIAALGLLTYGSWLAWHPAGFLTPGAVILGLSVMTDLTG